MATGGVHVEIAAKIPGEAAGPLTVIGEEYAIQGTMYRYGKWRHDIEHHTVKETAERIAGELNDRHREAGRTPDVEVAA